MERERVPGEKYSITQKSENKESENNGDSVKLSERIEGLRGMRLKKPEKHCLLSTNDFWDSRDDYVKHVCCQKHKCGLKR